MSTVTIYSRDDCPFCDHAQKLCEERKFEHVILKLGVDYTREELKELVPTVTTVPQIFVGKELVGGFTEFAEYVSQGKLT